jgi:hypothetical protein
MPNMTYEQVERFVDESFALDWEWERIRFLGGEPTLHPNFAGLIGLLVKYRQRYPKVFLQVLTNGRGRSAEFRDWLKELNISLHAETKTKGEQPPWFNNFRITPVDRDPNVGELEPCGIFGIRCCGLGLTRNGYFLDGAGAAVARVAGHDIGIMHLKDVTWDAMMAQAKVLCRICGHWNPMDGTMVSKLVKETGEVTGAFWTEKLAAYQRERPKMRVYGEMP